MSLIPTTLPDELDRQLDSALKATFPASDPVSVASPSGTEPDRPLHRRPAALDVELVEELARNLHAAHQTPPGTEKPKLDVKTALDLDEDLETLAAEPVDTDSNDVPTADANGDSDDERADENQAVPDPS